MIIETKIPADINQFKTKLIGPLTARQTICGAIAIAVDIPVLILLSHFSPGLRAIVYIILIIDVPIIAMSFDIDDVPMTTYLTKILLPSFTYPVKRKNMTVIQERQDKPISRQEARKREKREAKAAKKNPMYVSCK